MLTQFKRAGTGCGCQYGVNPAKCEDCSYAVAFYRGRMMNEF